MAGEHPQQADGVRGAAHRRLEGADARCQVGADRHAVMRRVDIGIFRRIAAVVDIVMSGRHVVCSNGASQRGVWR